jgi:hypothetical protein
VTAERFGRAFAEVFAIFDSEASHMRESAGARDVLAEGAGMSEDQACRLVLEE